MEKIKQTIKQNPKAFNTILLIAITSIGALIGILTGSISAEDAINSIVSVVKYTTMGL